MPIPPRHRWDVTYHEAVAIQERLAQQVVVRPLGAVHLAAGVDVAYSRATDFCYAAVVLFDLESGEALETASAEGRSTFPYIPGLLTFREGPHVLEAMARLTGRPDVLLVDGQGVAHPRRFGIASHLGVVLDVPSVGCAKSRLIGQHEEPGDERGTWAELVDDGEVIGRALRTRAGVKPVYVSVGHLCDLESATRLVLRAAPRWRLPEAVRLAHAHVTQMRRMAEGR